MSKIAQRDLDELIDAEIITPETAEKIGQFYAQKQAQSPNKLLIAFGVIGAMLIGLGIILIFAHNWDNLSTFSKTALAFTPMIIGQLLCGFTLLKKEGNIIWRESSSVFLFFAVAACIAMISQIYNLEGSETEFILTWMILTLPLMYVMESGATALLFLIGVTNLAGTHNNTIPFLYKWGLWIGALPFYYFQYQKSPRGVIIQFFHWLIVFSLIVLFFSSFSEINILILFAGFSLCSLFLMVGNGDKIKFNYRLNPYKLFGLLGTMAGLFILSFKDGWSEIARNLYDEMYVEDYVFFGVSFLLAFGFFIWKNYPGFKNINILETVFLVVIPVIFLGNTQPIMATIIVNLFLLFVGIIYIKKGISNNELGALNIGLITIVFLIFMRLVDIDISFASRGIIFVLIGIAFIVTNYFLIRQRNKISYNE